MGWRGFNCSIPHKVAIIEHLDGLGESAATIGAVNCAVRRGDKLIGENTDGVGFMESLRTLIDPRGKSIVVFGAGGAARAIAVESALAGAASMTIVNRGAARGRELDGADQRQDEGLGRSYAPWRRDLSRAERGGHHRQRDLDRALSPTSTPGSTSTSPTPNRQAIVADVIPNPPRTLLIREAEERGFRTLDGLGMLVNQGVVSIRHWFGLDVEPSVMRRKVEELFRA